MIPGRVARLSEEAQAAAATIGPVKSDIVKIAGTTTIDTITPTFGGRVWGQVIFLIPTDGAVTISTAGNVAAAITAAQNKTTTLVFVPSLSKWYGNAP